MSELRINDNQSPVRFSATGSEAGFSELAYVILSALFNRRNLIGQMEPGRYRVQDIKQLPEEEIGHHLLRIQTMIEQNMPIQMVLPAFPGKSPNRSKTLGHLPDLAERLALDSLVELCDEIKRYYAPGAKIVICSDGYVFSDLVRIPDWAVGEYIDELKKWADVIYPGYFSFFDLVDAYPKLTCLSTQREELVIEFAEPIMTLKSRARTDAHIDAMYRGITRFLYEDYKGVDEFDKCSNSNIQKNAKAAAYRVIQRSNAWSELLAKKFKEAVRLSIHPQFEKSSKIGIRLVSSLDIWRTPWHSVAVRNGDKVFLEKRSNIDEACSRLVFKRGRPCHYVYAD